MKWAMNKGRLVASALAVLMLLCTSSVFAKTGDIDSVVFDLVSLGILKEEPKDLQGNVTRADFCGYIVRMLGLDSAAQSVSTPSRFTDVPDGHEARAEIELLAGLNLIGGVGNSLFDPEGLVTRQQAAKVVVAALGYSVPAQQGGGYPDGFMAVAAQLGLFNRIETTGVELTLSDLLRMVENALDVDRMVMNGSGYEKERGNTLRNQFANQLSAGLEKRTGIVTATVDTWLIAPVANMTENKIQIDGKLYDLADTSARAYIGQRVDYYVYTDDWGGTERVERVRPDTKNQIYTIDVKDIIKADVNRVEFEIETERNGNETLSIRSDAVVVRNRQMEINWTAANLTRLQRGSVTFIDNDNDGEMEVILAEEYESAVVESVMEPNTVVYFRNGFTVGGQKNLELDPSDTNLFVSVYDEDGTAVAPSEVRAGDVLTVAVSTDETRVTAKISRRRVSGTVTEINKDEIRIDEDLYRVEEANYVERFSVGEETTVFLSAYGEIVFKQESGTENYGYVVGVSAGNSGISKDYQVKLLIPDLLSEKQEEVENEEGGETKTIAVLSCRNEAVRIVALADKVTLVSADGESRVCSSETAAGIIQGNAYQVRYNSKGEIVRLTEPEQIGDHGSRVYNSYERTFGGSTVSVGFGVDEHTRTVCIPKAPDGGESYSPSDDDYLVRVEMNNGQWYSVAAFDKDKDTKTAGLIVVEITMSAGNPGIISSKSDVAMVNQANKTIDENGCEVYKFVLMTKDKEKTYTVSPLVQEGIADRTDFASVRQGDLVAYSLDSSDRIDACRVLGSIYKQEVSELLNENRENETFFGYLNDAEYDEVSAKLNRWVHRLTVELTPGGGAARSPYEIARSNGAPVFIYYKSKNTAELGNIKQIRPGNDQIFVSAAYGTVRAIVVVR